MHVSPGNKHISIVEMGTAGETLPQEPEAVEPTLQHTLSKVFGLACLPPKGAVSRARTRGVDGRRDKTTSSWERRRGNASLAESIMRRLIGDDAKHVDDSVGGARSVPHIDRSFSSPSWLLDCAITGMPSVSVLKPSPSRFIHISTRLGCPTPPQ